MVQFPTSEQAIEKRSSLKHYFIHIIFYLKRD